MLSVEGLNENLRAFEAGRPRFVSEDTAARGFNSARSLGARDPTESGRAAAARCGSATGMPMPPTPHDTDLGCRFTG